MSCKTIENLLSEYIDGTLPEKERIHVEDHVRRCSACAAALDTVRSAAQAVSRLERKTAPADFCADLMERIEKSSEGAAPVLPAPRRSPVSLRVILPLAAAVIVALSFYLSSLDSPSNVARDPELVAAFDGEEGDDLRDGESLKKEFIREKHDRTEGTAAMGLAVEPESRKGASTRSRGQESGAGQAVWAAGAKKKEADKKAEKGLEGESVDLEDREAEWDPDPGELLDKIAATEKGGHPEEEAEEAPGEKTEECDEEMKRLDVNGRVGKERLLTDEGRQKAGTLYREADPDTGSALNCLVVYAGSKWKAPAMEPASPGPSGPSTRGPAAPTAAALKKGAKTRSQLAGGAGGPLTGDPVSSIGGVEYALFDVDSMEYQSLVKRYVSSRPAAVQACVVDVERRGAGNRKAGDRRASENGSAGFLTGRGRKDFSVGDSPGARTGLKFSTPVTLWIEKKSETVLAHEIELLTIKKESDASFEQSLEKILQVLPVDCLFEKVPESVHEVEAKRREKAKESDDRDSKDLGKLTVAESAQKPRKRKVIVVIIRDPVADGKTGK